MTPRAVRVYSVRILCLGDVGLIDDDGPIPKTNGYARAWPSGRLLSRREVRGAVTNRHGIISIAPRNLRVSGGRPTKFPWVWQCIVTLD